MRRHLLGCSSALAFALLAPSLARAQAPPPQAQATPAQGADATDVGEVVVTARKRFERLRDVPVSASVIGAGEIDQRGGLTGVKDLVTTVPSVAFGDTSTPLTSEISIRGSGTSRGTSADSGVGLYRDGAYVGGGAQGGRTFSRFDLFDVSQIEVLRGTQGALYGRDAVGGAINVMAARPTQTESGYVSAKAGNVEYGEIEAVVNHPLTDHLAVRISADFMSQPGGFYKNPDFDAYVDAQATHAIRGQVRYENGNFDANLMLEHAEDKYPGLNLQLYIQPNPNEPKGVFIQGMFDRPHNTKDIDKDQIDDAELTMNYRFGFGTLTSITLLRNRRDIQQFDNDLFDPALLAQVQALGLLAPGVTFDPFGGRVNQGLTTTFNQQLYLSGDISRQLKYVVGFEYLNQDDADTVVIQKSPTKASPSTGTSSPTTITLDSVAAYGSLEYDPTSRLSLTGQLRYTEDEKHFSTNQFDLGTGVAAAGKAIAADFSPDNISYDFTASYKVASQWLTYAKVGTAFRAGGFNNNLGDPRQPIPVPVSFGNENSMSYELGVKGNITRHIYVTAAGYYTDVDNLIIQTDNGCKATNPACPVAQTTFATDGGRAHVSGFETELNVNYPLFGGVLAGTIGGSVQGGKITEGVYNGLQPPQLPRYLASTNMGYTHTLPGGFTGFGNVVYAARWGGVQEIAQTPELHDYQLVNTRFGVRKGRVEVAGYINNVGDITYISFEATTARRYTTPRTFGGQVIYRW